jgi:hypothetical protein
LPSWEADFQYAEQFGIQPQDVRASVKLTWWRRWVLRKQAYRARTAYERASHSDDWTKDLTEAERDAMDWAAEKEESESDERDKVNHDSPD